MKITRRTLVIDRSLGVPLYRTWFPWDAVEQAIHKLKPDVVIVPAHNPVRIALAAKAAGAKVLMMLQDLDFEMHGGNFKDLGQVPCIANSQFTANAYRAAFGVSPKVIHPIINAKLYKTTQTGKNVTFINPHPKKGDDIALEMARLCPDIPFIFQQSWPFGPEIIEPLLQKIIGKKNISLRPPTENMKSVYALSRLVIMPSQWEEAFGRVAAEAQISGIPVIGSNIGGIPEAVGPGGILVDPKAPIGRWVEALRSLWVDQAKYELISGEALKHAARVELNPEYQIDAWENALRFAAAGKIDTNEGFYTRAD